MSLLVLQLLFYLFRQQIGLLIGTPRVQFSVFATIIVVFLAYAKMGFRQLIISVQRFNFSFSDGTLICVIITLPWRQLILIPTCGRTEYNYEVGMV